VVVSIIALLLAILLPMLRKAREQAKRAACQANLRQLAQAWHMYFDAHDGRPLRGTNWNRNFGGRQGTSSSFGWHLSAGTLVATPKPLNPYLKLEPVLENGGEAFLCPADQGGFPAVGTFFQHYGNSYLTNDLVIGPHQLSTGSIAPCVCLWDLLNARLPRLNLSQIGNASRLVLLGDGGWLNTWHPGLSRRIEWHFAPDSHNIAFLDTHVEFIRMAKGQHVTPNYTVVPFQDLQDDAGRCQRGLRCD
jgi:type II secretory pathway pseudopilin PulG